MQQRERQMQQRQPEGEMHQEAMGISGDDQCIQMLKQKLTDEDLRDIAQDIYVTCNEGTMAFYGYVKSEEAKQQLAQVAKQIEGLQEVENNLTVQESWEKKADSELQSDVESQLWWSPFIDSNQIDVTVRNGVVTLSGRVQDWEAAKAAVKNAYDAGAKRVKSRLQHGRQSQQQQQTADETEQE
jgi:osmotically-inducible protein OsmY